MSSDYAFDSADSRGSESGDVEAVNGPATLDAILGTDRERVVTVAGGVAALAVAFAAVVRVARNVPADSNLVPDPLYSLATVGTPVVVGAALLAVALASNRPVTRVGLAFTGAFTPLAAIDPAASLAAVAAVTVGGGLGVLGALDVRTNATNWEGIVPLAITGGFVLAIAISLAASTATIDGGLRPFGAAIALLATGALAWRAVDERAALFVGVLAGIAALALAGANPFAAGGALLAGFAVVGVPHLLVGVAVAGGAAAITAGVLRREPALVAGASLVLFAGMPTTAPRASALILGVALAVVGPTRLTAPRSGNEITQAEATA